MRLVRDLCGPCLSPAGSVLAIGAFDGLHRGHRALLAAVRESAAQRGLASAAVLFEPLPRRYFAREPFLRLIPPAQRIQGLAQAGLDQCLLLRFNAALASMSPEAFVAAALVERLAAREVWVGADFRFGHARAGDVERLRALGQKHGFAVRVLDTVAADAERISSSRLRAALLAGDFAAAATLLGAPYHYCQRVTRGQQLGRQLGYPTANLRWLSPLMHGIYAVRVSGAGLDRHPAVASIGTRPTVNGREPLLEVHLFDWSGDLYGQRLTVEFVARQRDELKFDSLDALVQQMDRDAAEARAILAARP
ncbi:MAG: bifunctional riboflavin kinase/FAD synthetase [Xanthomonadales bacterium]|jgi:riboflavin kinase/FMN adenylyltransferase|nr:bifunctional riboflavin kinase/FAD synthetase [Xanthomonadales bacterium]